MTNRLACVAAAGATDLSRPNYSLRFWYSGTLLRSELSIEQTLLLGNTI